MASTGETWRRGRVAAWLVAALCGSLFLLDAAADSSPTAQPLGRGESGTPAMVSFTNDDMRAVVLSPDKAGALVPLPGSVPYADPDSSVGVRDPSMARVGGRYLLAHTRAPKDDILGHESTWGLAASDDLRSFDRIAVVTPRLPGIYTIWAPDLLVDGGTVYCYWTGATEAGGPHQSYVQHASVDDLTDWSRPTLVRGLGGNVLDLGVVRVGSGYVGVFKDENVSRLHLARAASPLGPFVADTKPLPTGPDRVEGPGLVRAPSGRWLLTFDPFDTDRLAFMRSADLRHWTDPAPLAAAPGLRHPSVVWLSQP